MQRHNLAGVTAWVVLFSCLFALLYFGLRMLRLRLETGNAFPEYSSYRADPKGLKALYESLNATGLIRVARRLQSSRILPPGENQVLVVAGVHPDQQIVSDEDVQLFDHWLATGGRLIIALRSEADKKAGSKPDQLANHDATDNILLISWRNLIRRWGAEIASPNDIQSTTANSTLFGTISHWQGRDGFVRLTPDWNVIALQGNKNAIVERAFAHGSLVLLGDSYPLSNEAVAENRNTAFLLWLVDNRRGVTFEETHLGLSERPGIMTLAGRYGLQGTLISVVAGLMLFIWKCQYTLFPRKRSDQNALAVQGCSSEQAFLNLLQRTISQKDLLDVCISSWTTTTRPTAAQLASLEKFRADFGGEQSAVEGYNRLTTLLNEKSLGSAVQADQRTAVVSVKRPYQAPAQK